MKKSAIVLFFAAFVSISAIAQSVEEGLSHLYAERYQSAKSTFEKMGGGNAKNDEATYWLGQTLIEMKDTAAAEKLYQEATAANDKSGLLLAGLGHIDLMRNRTAEARTKFEKAIEISNKKRKNDPAVLNAVGRANVEAKAGDPAYAITKLTEASELANTNADIFVNLGNAYRKAHNGGQAVVNYARARTLNPKSGMGSYRMAKLYQTQNNWDVVTEHLNNAIAADPAFAPALMELYYYNLLYKKDFPTAEAFAQKYIANSDPSVENDYLKAQTDFVQEKYDEAIATGKNIIATAGENVNPRVYRLLAYAHLEKGDTTGAKPYVDQLFAKADDEFLIGQDYLLRGDIYSKDNPNIVKESYLEAARMDSVLANQINLLNQGIERFKTSGQKQYEGDLRLLSYQLRGDQANPAELFYIGIPYYQSGNYQLADSVFKGYITAFPDSIYGHLVERSFFSSY